MNRFVLIVALLASSLRSQAQDISAFADIRERFHVFDKGATKQLDHNPVQSYSVGWNQVAFVDNLNRFKLYRDGLLTELNSSAPGSYSATRDLLIYRPGSLLNVVDNGKVVTLAPFADDYPYGFGDSIVVYGNSLGSFEVYFRGKKTQLEFEMPKSFVVGPNCVAYVTQSDEFKLFDGETHLLESTPPTRPYKIGSGMVAYIDAYDNFIVWWDGGFYELESFLPGYFDVGDDQVLYFTHLGQCRVFHEGTVTELMPTAPEQFHLKHNVLIYRDERGLMQVCIGGKSQTIDNFWPTYVRIEGAIVAWADEDGILMAHDNGNGYQVSQAVVDGRFRIDGQVIRYTEQTNEVRFWWQGERY